MLSVQIQTALANIKDEIMNAIKPIIVAVAKEAIKEAKSDIKAAAVKAAVKKIEETYDIER